MSVSSVGDLARLTLLRRHNAQTRTALDRLTTELSTGTAADPGRRVKGDFTALAAIDRGLRLTDAYATAGAEAALRTAAMNTALGTVAGGLTGLGTVLLGTAGAGSATHQAAAAGQAEQILEQAIGALNTRVAGRSLFAADAPDRPALAGAGPILDALAVALPPGADAGTMIATVEDWFLAPGGGYETTAYTGGAGAVPAVALAEGENVSSGVSALSLPLRKALSGLALAALAARGEGPADPAARREILHSAGARLIEGHDAVSLLRADLGQIEARIETTRTRGAATRTALEMERARLLAADPYDTATEIEALRTRMESLYLLTARLSRLSLAEFLR